jgi:hypothetical protein
MNAELKEVFLRDFKNEHWFMWVSLNGVSAMLGATFLCGLIAIMADAKSFSTDTAVGIGAVVFAGTLALVGFLVANIWKQVSWKRFARKIKADNLKGRKDFFVSALEKVETAVEGRNQPAITRATQSAVWAAGRAYHEGVTRSGLNDCAKEHLVKTLAGLPESFLPFEFTEAVKTGNDGRKYSTCQIRLFIWNVDLIIDASATLWYAEI